MKMHVLSGGRLRMRRRVYIPEAAKDETIDLPVACFLLRHPQGNVLFDTGCHPDTATDPAGATVVFGHDLAQWETLKKGADAYD